jgi:formylmethanofuran dehydrogenase subunit E
MIPLKQLMDKSAAGHSHLCPRQVLGVRMGLLACDTFRIEVPDNQKRLITLMETDGCAVDGVSAATGCTVGNRRLRVLDYGKIAATFVDMESARAIRIVPRNGIREDAQRWVTDAECKWEAQLKAYQTMPDEDLLVVKRVTLIISLDELLSKPGCRVNCSICGEEIINEREVYRDASVLCRACAGESYYQLDVEEQHPAF